MKLLSTEKSTTAFIFSFTKNAITAETTPTATSKYAIICMSISGLEKNIFES